MKSIFLSKLFIAVSFSLITIPYFSLALVVDEISPYPYPVYGWGIIVFLSTMIFLIIFLMWLFSPLGLIFTASTLAQFLISKKEVRVIAWAVQSLIFIFTILISAIGIIFSLSRYGEERYVFLISFSSVAVTICLLMIGVMIVQFIWQKRRRDTIQ